jgi:uncharacterized membrane protein
MLLNHVVVGILLLPLGFLVVFAAPHAAATAIVCLAGVVMLAAAFWPSPPDKSDTYA